MLGIFRELPVDGVSLERMDRGDFWTESVCVFAVCLYGGFEISIDWTVQIQCGVVLVCGVVGVYHFDGALLLRILCLFLKSRREHIAI